MNLTQLPSQCTYQKEGCNLRTLEKTVTMVYTTLIRAFGVPVSLRWSVPPLVLVQCVEFLYIILQAFLIDCICKSQTYKLLFLDFYT
jgi:hypothetical protein